MVKEIKVGDIVVVRGKTSGVVTDFFDDHTAIIRVYRRYSICTNEWYPLTSLTVIKNPLRMKNKDEARALIKLQSEIKKES